MKHITKGQLIEILSKIKGAQPIAFTAITPANMRKTDNPFYPARKVCRVFAFTGVNYEAAVNRQRAREDKPADFHKQPRIWGRRVSPALAVDQDRFYLVAKVERRRNPIYIYNNNGINEIVSTEKIKSFLPIEKPTSQGLEKEVEIRNYSIDSIISISIDKEKYRII